MHHFNSKCIIDIDLPGGFYRKSFPKCKNFITGRYIVKDFIFLTQIKLLDDNLIDLFINIASFQEMNMFKS